MPLAQNYPVAPSARPLGHRKFWILRLVESFQHSTMQASAKRNTKAASLPLSFASRQRVTRIDYSARNDEFDRIRWNTSIKSTYRVHTKNCHRMYRWCVSNAEVHTYAEERSDDRSRLSIEFGTINFGRIRQLALFARTKKAVARRWLFDSTHSTERVLPRMFTYYNLLCICHRTLTQCRFAFADLHSRWNIIVSCVTRSEKKQDLDGKTALRRVATTAIAIIVLISRILRRFLASRNILSTTEIESRLSLVLPQVI